MDVYLNAAQKQSLVMLLACAQFLDRAVEKSADKLPKDVASSMRKARTWAQKAADTWLDVADMAARRAVVNIIRDLDIGVLTRADKAQLRELRQYLGGQEYAFRLAEMAMVQRCRGCDGSPRDGCDLYESLKHFDVPPWDETHERCEYAGAGEIQP
jgi:hypothetical protein